ncbi:BspA family leucine-rich repeat surface protein [Ichthyobacterium seriolicida]|uniref:PKD domain-containing protein n=1 Tax=Ichthyobacterium seriolicida TaxID=242600 RepID=A0A1J1DY02_9FLAO|nr:BspA family leucine-rich repeat surface protein [Ichthyobacterium seriolicida]BAV94762.1 hypothetical protein JBKA6_0749 [Ichthyobacterium seriolicida]
MENRYLVLIFLITEIFCSCSRDTSNIKPNSFISKWKISEGKNESNTVILPLYAGGDYDFHVDWGDGTEKQRITSDNLKHRSHEYKVVGEYCITITGKIIGFNFTLAESLDEGTSTSKIIEILDWGDLELGYGNNLGSHFKYCSNLTTLPSSAPNLIELTNMKEMFFLCTKLDADLGNWDVSKVTNMESMFEGCESFVGRGLKNWDVSNVNNMTTMFSMVWAMGEDLSRWNVSNVANHRGFYLKHSPNGVFSSSTEANKSMGNFKAPDFSKSKVPTTGATRTKN